MFTFQKVADTQHTAHGEALKSDAITGRRVNLNTVRERSGGDHVTQIHHRQAIYVFAKSSLFRGAKVFIYLVVPSCYCMPAVSLASVSPIESRHALRNGIGHLGCSHSRRYSYGGRDGHEYNVHREVF